MLVGVGFTPGGQEFGSFSFTVNRSDFPAEISFAQFVGLSFDDANQLRAEFADPFIAGALRIEQATSYVDKKLKNDAEAAKAQLAAAAAAQEREFVSCIQYMIGINTNRLPKDIEHLMYPVGTEPVKPSSMAAATTDTPADAPGVAA
jgi:hypothetical protein